MYGPAVLVVGAAVMTVGVTRPRDGTRPPVPAELMAASLALPAWAIAAGSLLGGSGETVIC